MIEALFNFLVEVLLYGKGYAALRLLSLGRIKPSTWNDSMVSVVGLLVTLAWCVPLLFWLGGDL
ncbi:hypothetical protein [Pseudomonas xionganensis]|uniref:Uncharacterized protein n=1 Tax=Pseudomonas xionganensis TaxID=2654845 RepID=A0A6I4KSQ9_9PSED|nr:hypothetical protein [Pseudomonas xionganensis]MVW74731.1 hypothetical protein [Pseudomonas xionganensis]